MSKMMMKMLADMAGITPEQLTESMNAFQQMATQGIETLEKIDARLSAIEQHLGILQTVENISPQLERLDHGKEIGTASAT